MIRYNEDPCLNLNGPERKFKLLFDNSTLFLFFGYHRCSEDWC